MVGPASGHAPETRTEPRDFGDGELPRVGWVDRRIHGWTWQAFPIGMGTGAVYVLLSGMHYHWPVLTRVETGFYILNLFLFVVNTTMLALQAFLYPKQSLRLLRDPMRGIFVPLIGLSFATIIIGTINYTVPAEPKLVYALFWIYTALAVMICFPMLMIWFSQPHELVKFTPGFAFLIFPMVFPSLFLIGYHPTHLFTKMLVGVVAFNALRVIEASDPRSIGILLTGYFFQGLGSFMTFIYIGIYVLRIMTTGFLEGHQANGAFVACGPPGFTALALIKLGSHSREILTVHNLVSPAAGEIWYAWSVLMGLMLFGVAVFLFLFGALPYWFKIRKDLNEILGCWALTFPNVGWIATLEVLGDIFHIRGLYIVYYVMTALICLVWCILIVLTALAFWKGLIFRSPPEDVIQDVSLSPRPAVAREKRRARDSGSSSGSQASAV
ncbi:hypothetical protein HGRIS_006432 [Hohenbuehelia grisea]|uniref:C4-dicarboxylate transporter/malic acid transport protein n=1 Tax=Hohenbuehelia grisea TaxID=104357 RepID=A0ABR3K199_9AGAR